MTGVVANSLFSFTKWVLNFRLNGGDAHGYYTTSLETPVLNCRTDTVCDESWCLTDQSELVIYSNLLKFDHLQYFRSLNDWFRLNCSNFHAKVRDV